MKIICKARGHGKTTELIKEAKKLEGYNLIVCMNMREAERIWEEIVRKKHNLPKPILFDDFIKGNYFSSNVNCFLIDNADKLIEYISRGVRIHAITFTDDK